MRRNRFDRTTLNSLPGLETGVEIIPESGLTAPHKEFLNKANLANIAPVEAWTVEGSNAAINYSTHGIYRYFGKFPAPIARQLILDYSKPEGLIIDPACGSGTTGVEALWLGNRSHLYDINPLSVLVTKVKTRHISEARLNSALEAFETRYKSSRVKTFETSEIDLHHWFLPETIKNLARIKAAIAGEEKRELNDFLTMIFASIVRKTSRATTQQGRLFLDVETAVTDVLPLFVKSARKAASRISLLPKGNTILVRQENLLENDALKRQSADLVIYHPPYFNAYKYSSINSLELAWLDLPRKVIRKGEIREFFKVGKLENAEHYVLDMAKSLLNIEKFMNKRSRLAVMIGDALMKDQHLPVTAQLIDAVSSTYEVERTVVRVPKYTEASWASSQRRAKKDLGVTMFDFIVTLRKR